MTFFCGRKVYFVVSMSNNRNPIPLVQWETHIMVLATLLYSSAKTSKQPVTKIKKKKKKGSYR